MLNQRNTSEGWKCIEIILPNIRKACLEGKANNNINKKKKRKKDMYMRLESVQVKSSRRGDSGWILKRGEKTEAAAAAADVFQLT